MQCTAWKDKTTSLPWRGVCRAGGVAPWGHQLLLAWSSGSVLGWKRRVDGDRTGIARGTGCIMPDAVSQPATRGSAHESNAAGASERGARLYRKRRATTNIRSAHVRTCLLSGISLWRHVRRKSRIGVDRTSPRLPQTQHSGSIGMSRNSKRLQRDWSARSSWLPETVCRLNRFTAGV